METTMSMLTFLAYGFAIGVGHIVFAIGFYLVGWKMAGHFALVGIVLALVFSLLLIAAYTFLALATLA